MPNVNTSSNINDAYHLKKRRYNRHGPAEHFNDISCQKFLVQTFPIKKNVMLRHQPRDVTWHLARLSFDQKSKPIIKRFITMTKTKKKMYT